VQPGEEHTRCFADSIGDHCAVVELKLEGGTDQLLWYLEQLLGQWHQLLRPQTTMAVLHGLCQGVGYPRAHTDRGDLFDAKLHGDRVCSLESDPTDIAREPVGVLGHYPDGVRAIGLEDPYGPGGTDPVTV
jgi:hypothetical protein